MTFIISIATGNVLNFGDSVELLALIGRARHPIERVVGLQRQMVNIKISLLKINRFMNQPEIRKNTDEVPNHPDYAIHIENKNFTWGMKTMYLNEWFENLAKTMRWEFKLGRREKNKTEEQLKEIEKRERERAQ
jgi:tRNA(His) 5'-end guanylyltransferase